MRRRLEVKLALVGVVTLGYVLGLLCLIGVISWRLVGMIEAGQPAGKQKTLEFSGTAPVGTYTYPASFANGRATGAGMTRLGVEVTRDQLTNLSTLVELVIEVSYDGGWTWPPGCVSAPTCRCHDATQDASQPLDTRWCSFTFRGGGPIETDHLECRWSRVTDNQTRMRGRLHVCGASATGSIYTTWR